MFKLAVVRDAETSNANVLPLLDDPSFGFRNTPNSGSMKNTQHELQTLPRRRLPVLASEVSRSVQYD
ncbi:hypothetical protein CKO51_20875 [Rhodopirellula sp. SM50]|nr:hypothetical protein CKO51_20875 [Rhodopirellula sp. SM50]